MYKIFTYAHNFLNTHSDVSAPSFLWKLSGNNHMSVSWFYSLISKQEESQLQKLSYRWTKTVFRNIKTDRNTFLTVKVRMEKILKAIMYV